MTANYMPWPTARKVNHYRMPFRLKGPKSEVVHVEEPYWKFEPLQWHTMCGKTLPAGSSLATADMDPVTCARCRSRIMERIAVWSLLLDEEVQEP